MTTRANKIISALTQRSGLSDRELAETIYGRGKPQQLVNDECRLLAQGGIITRQERNDGIIGNYLEWLK